MPPKNNIELGEGKIFLVNKETGEEIEFGGLKEANLTEWDEPTASSRWNDDGISGAIEFSVNILKWKKYKQWLKLLGVDYDELTFRYKLEFIFCFIINKIQKFKR